MNSDEKWTTLRNEKHKSASLSSSRHIKDTHLWHHKEKVSSFIRLNKHEKSDVIALDSSVD